MTRRFAAPLALLPLALALAACKPAAEPAAEPAAAPAATAEAPAAPVESGSVAGTDATAVVHHDQPDPAGFDRKAFAGAFAGIVPCADCPGIETRLAIRADGTFTLDETYQERGAGSRTTGTWTLHADGRRLLLDPDAKDAADRRFEIMSKDEIRMLGADGSPIASELNYSLRRG